MARQRKYNKNIVKDLAEILTNAELSEIEVEEGDFRIRVVKNSNIITNPAIANEVSYQSPTPPFTAAQSQSAPTSDSQATNLSANAAGDDASSKLTVVTSPMVGTVYSCPEPGAASFIEEGNIVKKGQTLLIIEAMKVMNTIPAPVSGKVIKISFADGQPVEYGEPLIEIE